ncbi:hypothetical protein OJF2_39690 [Aquisphaera giovannonii]|uniref:Uncharacterized protein n=1 Tax=Aquisphaera giovannonii TaxID=406548 RepID=A0A5B9W560_9BACT|nr:hypothetical protein OJF2_39690 [Aquisphaera giovannonii]
MIPEMVAAVGVRYGAGLGDGLATRYHRLTAGLRMSSQGNSETMARMIAP